MHKTSRDTERKVFQLHFQGDSNYTIALKLEIPRSTVSDIVTLLPESITPLQDLSKDLKKQDLTVFEAKKGTQFIARLADLGVSFDQLQSFVESAEKMRANPDYTPKQIVQGAMRLSDVEQQFGKSYSETLLDFEEKKDQIKELEKEESQLKEQVNTLQTYRKRTMEENNVTKKDLAYVANLRQNIRKYGIELSDVENLKKYLENMQETGTNPRIFVQYAEEHGFLKRNLAQLKRENQLEAANLQRQQQETQLAKTTIDVLQAQISSLQKERNREQDALSTLHESCRQLQQKYQEGLAALATLLKVKAEAERINEALASMVAKQRELSVEIAEKQQLIQTLQQRNQALENKRQSIEGEIQGKLKIRDYVTELVATIASQESEKTFLEKENCEKRERLALADVITEFLTRIPRYDFSRLHSHVEMIKRLREKAPNSHRLQLSVIEEQTRALALKVFEGDLVPTHQHMELMRKYEKSERDRFELEKKARELEVKNEETKSDLEHTAKEKQLLEALKINFAGRSTALAELRNWTLSIFSEEIERKVDERLMALGVGAYNVFSLAFKKLTGRS